LKKKIEKHGLALIKFVWHRRCSIFIFYAHVHACSLCCTYEE